MRFQIIIDGIRRNQEVDSIVDNLRLFGYNIKKKTIANTIYAMGQNKKFEKIRFGDTMMYRCLKCKMLIPSHSYRLKHEILEHYVANIGLDPKLEHVIHKTIPIKPSESYHQVKINPSLNRSREDNNDKRKYTSNHICLKCNSVFRTMKDLKKHKIEIHSY